MKFKFVVLSCDKYLETRIPYLTDSFLLNQSYVILTDSKSEKSNIVGYDTPQNYLGIQDKYKRFFLNYDFTTHDYWFFIDDDTFVNLKNLENLDLKSKENKFCVYKLAYLDENALDWDGRYTGYPLNTIQGHETELPIKYPSGGSGFILSQSLCIEIQNILRSLSYDMIATSSHSDVTVGFWIRSAGGELIENKNFWNTNIENLEKDGFDNFLNDSITFHHVSEEQMFEYNKKFNL